MMHLQRLNHDSSWYFQWGESRFLVDPWLLGSEVDGFRWLNEQWHVHPPVPLAELPPYDFILISQSYADHCHLPTLRALDDHVPILATGKAYAKLKHQFPDREIHLLPTNGEHTDFGGLKFGSVAPNKRMDPVYYAVWIASPEGRAVFYSPHGFALEEPMLSRLDTLDFRLLITTFTEFRLPAIMGGKVNPGMENVYRLCEQLNPAQVINTHDEQKVTKGLVGLLAKIRYPDLEAVARSTRMNLLRIEDYNPRRVD